MIFRRGKKKAVEPAVDESTAESPVELGSEGDFGDLDPSAVEQDALTSTDPAPTDPAPSDLDSDALDPGAPELDLAELDARDWRAEGPYDISELDPDDEREDGIPRIDLGSMIVTGFAGAELRLQVSEETSQLISAMLISGGSALELGAYAAPRSGGLWSELREDMIESATDAGGSTSLVEGPFGVELRRFLPVTTPDGEEGYQPSRMWMVEGPRWLLRGIVYGEAALAEGVEPPVAELLAAFRKVVVRRGDEAMAPGDLLPLSMPENLVAAEPAETT